MPLADVERCVCEAIAAERDRLVDLASRLVGFDTTARQVGDRPRQEAALQEYLAGRLADAGAHVDMWEPDAGSLEGKPLVPPGLDFAGRPQLIASLKGSGANRSLVFNGHIELSPLNPSTAGPAIRSSALSGTGCFMAGARAT